MPSSSSRRPAPRGRPHSGNRGGGLPPALVVVLAIVLLEAVVLAGLALWAVVELVTAGSPNVGVAMFIILFCAAVAVGLVLGARGLRDRRRGARAPVVTWQLLQGATAITVVQGTGQPLAWVPLGLAVVVAVLMMTRPVVEHTVPR